MEFNKRLAIWMLYIVIGLSSKADIVPIHLQMQLINSKNVVAQNERFMLKLRFTNSDIQSHSILIPGAPGNGNKMIYFSYYKVEGTYYREVYRESREIRISDTNRLQANFKHLHAGESVDIPIFMNDSLNAGSHIESSYKLPALPPGEYQLLAFYNPFNDPMSSYCFTRLDFLGYTDSLATPWLLSLPHSGIQSQYLSLKITERIAFQPTSVCQCNTSLCMAIEKEKWNKMKRILKRQTSSKKGRTTKLDLDNPPCRIVFVYSGPDAILSSLPSGYSRRIVVESEEELRYFNLYWQLGKIYPMRSKIKYGIDAVFNTNVGIKTSSLSYIKLKSCSQS